jgi:hypothetical protein
MDAVLHPPIPYYSLIPLPFEAATVSEGRFRRNFAVPDEACPGRVPEFRVSSTLPNCRKFRNN